MQGGLRIYVCWDANRINSPDNRMPPSSDVMMVCNVPVSFNGSTQGLTAQSTIEAELVAGVLAMRGAVFCQK